MRRPGFLSGAQSLVDAFRFLFRTPEAWPAALVPAVLFLLLAALATLGAWAWLVPEMIAALGLKESSTWWGGAGTWLLSIVLSLLGTLAGVWLSLVLTPPLSAPAMEHLVLLQESELSMPARTPRGFFAEFVCGLRAQLFAVLFATPALALLWLAGFVFPPLVVVTLPLKYIVLASGIAWNLFDYPLTLRGIGASDRFGFIAAHWRAALGFGLAFAAFFWIPCFGVLMLPVGVLAATRLVVRLLVSEPRELPTLPRPRSADFRGLGAPPEHVSHASTHEY